jgi:hypothetical protein
MLYANEVGIFYGSASPARYGINNSKSFIILTGLRDNFNVTHRNVMLGILIGCVVIVIVVAIILGCKVFKSANLILKEALKNFKQVNGSQDKLKAL